MVAFIYDRAEWFTKIQRKRELEKAIERQETPDRIKELAEIVEWLAEYESKRRNNARTKWRRELFLSTSI